MSSPPPQAQCSKTEWGCGFIDSLTGCWMFVHPFQKMGGPACRIFMLLSPPFPLLYTRPSLLRLALPQSRLFLSQTSRLSLFPSPNFTTPIECYHSQTQVQSLRDEDKFIISSDLLPGNRTWYPWPEFSRFIERLKDVGYSKLNGGYGKFIRGEVELPIEFVKAANASLGFAQEKTNLLCSLSRRDIKVVVENGTPFLFEDGVESAKKMKSFLSDGTQNVFKVDKPSTVDLMKFLLSYASIATGSSGTYNINNKELVESSVRKLFGELADMVGSSSESVFSRSVQQRSTGRLEQTSRPCGQNVEMKRGDWICPRCNFHNFARNMKCLECEESRPKRQLSGGEWECPQCEFHNHARNSVCLRCDCKKTVASPGYTLNSRCDHTDITSAENEDKVQWWSSRISQLENSSESESLTRSNFEAASVFGGTLQNSETATNQTAVVSEVGKQKQRFVSSYQSKQRDNNNREQAEKSEILFKRVAEQQNVKDPSGGMFGEGLPEIMPMRKGENRFVVNSKKDRSFSSPPSKRHGAVEQAGTNNYVPFVPFPPDYFAKKDKLPNEVSGSNNISTAKTSSVSTSSDIAPVNLGDAKSNPHQKRQVQPLSNPQTGPVIQNSGGSGRSIDDATPDMHNSVGSRFSSQGSADKFVKSAVTAQTNVSGMLSGTQSVGDSLKGRSLEGSAVKDEPDPLDMSEEAKAERWFRRVAQIKDISELSQIPDEDFPSIMPLRKGVNRFVVSKRKTPLQRRLTSSQYRRNLPVVNSDPIKEENDAN